MRQIVVAASSPRSPPTRPGVPTNGSANIVGFDAGYVARTWGREVWFSPDGEAWESVELPFDASKSEYGQALDAGVQAIATDGDQVLVVGGYAHGPPQDQGWATEVPEASRRLAD